MMAALLGARKVTFTELLLAVRVPKSSLHRNLEVLEDHGFVKQSRGFLPSVSGPRSFVEITPKGEVAIRVHLETLRMMADKILTKQSKVETYPSPHDLDSENELSRILTPLHRLSRRIIAHIFIVNVSAATAGHFTSWCKARPGQFLSSVGQ
jgi:DNA-binding MarR family transcriptional regulator